MARACNRGIATLAVAIGAWMLFAPAAQAAFPGRNGDVSFARTGNLVTDQADVYTVDRFGTAEANITNQSYSRFSAWAPDGGRIAFSQNDKIYTANPDGSGKTLVLDWTGSAWDLDWSPDSTKLTAELWTCDTEECHQDIYTMNLDGTGLTNVTAGDGFDDRHPAWSPDGTRIAFDSVRNGASGIYTMDPDGSDVTAVTQNTSNRDLNPDWSPDGTRIAFSRGNDDQFFPTGFVYTMNADGSELTNLTGGFAPSWSPDGTRIAASGGGLIYTFTAEGNDRHRLTDPPDFKIDIETDWQPLPPVPAPPSANSGYPRPKGTEPLTFALVPAYAACTSPNRTHGPPLAFGSCHPPTQVSSQVTLGTADSNGAPTNGLGSVKLRTEVGVPGPPDDADVQITVSQTDVRRQGGLHDYPYYLDLRLPLRITDKFSAGGPDASATVEDFLLRFSVPCNPTAATTIGSQCELATTIESVYPGAIVEGKRSIWELGQVRLHDPGPDLDPETGPGNEVFMVQGVFVP